MRRGVWLLFCIACKGAPSEREEAEPIAVKCVTGERREVADTTVLRGRVATPPGGDLAIAAQVPGRLTSVDVHEGQKVVAGDAIASVDAGVSRDALRQAEAALAQVEANEANARATLERVKTLVTRGIAATQELDDARTRADALHADLAAARASVDLARRTLGRVVVRSSVAGTVTRIWRGTGALVDGTAATPVAQVAVSSVVEFVADATVKDLAHVEVGQTTRTTLVTGVIVVGTVIARPTMLDPSTGLGSVRVAMNDAPVEVAIGTFGSTRITSASRPGVLTFANSVLRGTVSDGAEVVVCQDKTVLVRRVDVGWRDAERVEVQGIAPNERLASEHVLGLESGQAIVEAE